MKSHFKDFPGTSYDHWKTTDPRDMDPDNAPELEDDLEADMIQCDCCQKMIPRDEINHIMPGPTNNAPCETFCCDECCGWKP